MKKFAKAIVFLVTIFVVVLLHVLAQLIFPAPWHHLHIVVLSLVLYMLWSESGLVVWMAFGMFFLLETMRTTSFGLTLFSGTLAVLGGLWLFRYIFTNRSWYVASVLTLLTLISYRALYTALILAVSSQGAYTEILNEEYGVAILWESVITSGIAAVAYGICMKFIKRFSTLKINE